MLGKQDILFLKTKQDQNIFRKTKTKNGKLKKSNTKTETFCTLHQDLALYTKTEIVA